MARIDPIRLEIFRHLFEAIAEEMGVALVRSASSPNIKERHDSSCAIFDEDGGMGAQAAHIPVHLGSTPLSVKACMDVLSFEPGDIAIVNDPYEGGTHLPDVTLVSPVFVKGKKRPAFYVANRAHHADIGGAVPGSMPMSTEIFQEGIRIPPVKIVERGKLNRAAWDILLRNVRTPEERAGDLSAQIAANKTGERRLLELVKKNGLDETLRYLRALQAYTEKSLRETIRRIPDGDYSAEDFMDGDGIEDRPIRIAVTIRIRGEKAVVDFTGSDPQVRGNVNTIPAITLSSVIFAFRCLVKENVPANAGLYAPIKVVAPAGSVVNALPPAAVCAGNVETSSRIVDVLFRALSKAMPDVIPAASQGSMNSLIVGGIDPRTGRPFTYYETMAGGMGARPGKDGLDAVHTNMTNTLNTPIEAAEIAYPFRVHVLQIRKGSGGKGRFKGGEGIRRGIEFLSDVTVSIITDRRKTRPYGLAGGGDGASGRNILIREGKESELPHKANIQASKGDIVIYETPGGGGFGAPETSAAGG
ncbi:MAG: hydantoinase B/oxoprolinase family protein [Planctomycetota bacterium]